MCNTQYASPHRQIDAHRLNHRRWLGFGFDLGVNGRKLKFWLHTAATPVYLEMRHD
jgi:hypothetical protein